MYPQQHHTLRSPVRLNTTGHSSIHQPLTPHYYPISIKSHKIDAENIKKMNGRTSLADKIEIKNTIGHLRRIAGLDHLFVGEIHDIEQAVLGLCLILDLHHQTENRSYALQSLLDLLRHCRTPEDLAKTLINPLSVKFTDIQLLQSCIYPQQVVIAQIVEELARELNTSIQLHRLGPIDVKVRDDFLNIAGGIKGLDGREFTRCAESIVANCQKMKLNSYTVSAEEGVQRGGCWHLDTADRANTRKQIKKIDRGSTHPDHYDIEEAVDILCKIADVELQTKNKTYALETVCKILKQNHNPQEIAKVINALAIKFTEVEYLERSTFPEQLLIAQILQQIVSSMVVLNNSNDIGPIDSRLKEKFITMAFKIKYLNYMNDQTMTDAYKLILELAAKLKINANLDNSNTEILTLDHLVEINGRSDPADKEVIGNNIEKYTRLAGLRQLEPGEKTDVLLATKGLCLLLKLDSTHYDNKEKAMNYLQIILEKESNNQEIANNIKDLIEQFLEFYEEEIKNGATMIKLNIIFSKTLSALLTKALELQNNSSTLAIDTTLYSKLTDLASAMENNNRRHKRALTFYNKYALQCAKHLQTNEQELAKLIDTTGLFVAAIYNAWRGDFNDVATGATSLIKTGIKNIGSTEWFDQLRDLRKQTRARANENEFTMAQEFIQNCCKKEEWKFHFGAVDWLCEVIADPKAKREVRMSAIKSGPSVKYFLTLTRLPEYENHNIEHLGKDDEYTDGRDQNKWVRDFCKERIDALYVFLTDAKRLETLCEQEKNVEVEIASELMKLLEPQQSRASSYMQKMGKQTSKVISHVEKEIAKQKPKGGWLFQTRK